MNAWQSDGNVGDYRFDGGQPMYYADYDIQNIWYNHAAPSQGHNVSVRGASNRTTYYLSFGYNYKEDNMKWNPAMRKRYNAAANISTDLTDWLTVGARINFSRRHFSRADTWNNMYQYIWRWGSFFIPSGTIADPATGEQLDFRVIAMQKQAARKNVTMDRLSMTAFTTVHITKDLTLKADFTYEIGNMNSGSSDHTVYGYNWSGVTPQWIVNAGNTNAWRDNSKSNKWAANATLNWNKSFNDVHNFNVMVGVNGDNYSSDYFYAYRPQLYSEEYPELALTYGDQTKWNINSSTYDKATVFIFSNATEVAQIYQMLLNGGELHGKRYLSESTCKLFTTSKSRISRRGLGFDKPDVTNKSKSPCADDAPATVYGHTGFTGTCVWVDPTNQIVYIFLSNRVHPDSWNPQLGSLNIRPRIQQAIYDAMK